MKFKDFSFFIWQADMLPDISTVQFTLNQYKLETASGINAHIGSTSSGHDLWEFVLQFQLVHFDSSGSFGEGLLR